MINPASLRRSRLMFASAAPRFLNHQSQGVAFTTSSSRLVAREIADVLPNSSPATFPVFIAGARTTDKASGSAAFILSICGRLIEKLESGSLRSSSSTSRIHSIVSPLAEETYIVMFLISIGRDTVRSLRSMGKWRVG